MQSQMSIKIEHRWNLRQKNGLGWN
jgi:hypothetical protein